MQVEKSTQSPFLCQCDLKQSVSNFQKFPTTPRAPRGTVFTRGGVGRLGKRETKEKNKEISVLCESV